jgi:hypothetical protein
MKTTHITREEGRGELVTTITRNTNQITLLFTCVNEEDAIKLENQLIRIYKTDPDSEEVRVQ